MNTGKTIISFTFSLLALALFGQENAPTQLDELIIEQQKISNQSKSQRTIVLNDSLMERNVGTFTELLQKNTFIYFKENGYGMVSSPSFRGRSEGTRLNSSHVKISYAVFCLKKKSKKFNI